MWKLVWCAIYFGPVCCQSGFIPDGHEEVPAEKLGSLGALEKCGEGEQDGLYNCVVYDRCDPNTNTIVAEGTNTNGFGLIDIRFGANKCNAILDVCCKIPSEENVPSANTRHPSPPPPSGSNFCGRTNPNGIEFKITGNTNNEAEYGEFPWMLAILKTNYEPSVDPVLAICGGSLIAPQVVLTAAHCVHKYKPSDLKVRAGEWDTQTEKERYPYQERNVADIRVHENFKSGILFNDVALLILEKAFAKAVHIATICLPIQDEVIDSENCIATGWGKNLFGKEGEFQVILKKIELPIVKHEECETSLRKTRLGQRFNLDESFVCAGGILGRDTCTGDGGSPLVCPDPKDSSRYVQAGIVAWGIGCGTTTPGVYADVAKVRSWVDMQMQKMNLSTKPYTL